MRSGAAPFFQLRPALLDPPLDGFVIAFGRLAGWSLPGPVQPVPQDVPHPRRVVAHASHALDDLSRPLQRPQTVRIPVGFSALEQSTLHLRKLFWIQLRQPSGSSSAAQCVPAGPPPRVPPI